MKIVFWNAPTSPSGHSDMKREAEESFEFLIYLCQATRRQSDKTQIYIYIYFKYLENICDRQSSVSGRNTTLYAGALKLVHWWLSLLRGTVINNSSFFYAFVYVSYNSSKEDLRKCVIPVVCMKLGKLYVVKHNCVTWGVFNDYIMDIGKTIPHPRPLEPPTTQHNSGEGRWTGHRTTTELHTCRAHPHNSFIFFVSVLVLCCFFGFLFLFLFLLIRSVCRDLYTTCACMLIVRS